MLTLVKILIPFLREALFGKEDPLAVLDRNKTSSILGVTVVLFGFVICGLMYINFKLYVAVKDRVIEPASVITPVVVQEAVKRGEEDQATLQVILAQLQRLEIKVTALQGGCKVLSNETAQTNPTETKCETGK